MQIIDNNSHLWGDDLKQALAKGSRVKIAASCFSIYAFEALMHVGGTADAVAYMPISGFTAVDLGYQKGDAVSNFVTRFDEAAPGRGH